jgi:hypothetical protein
MGAIDGLIGGNRFDEAMGALALYMRENPGDLDRAQGRVRHIAETRGRYNALVNRLLDLVARDPGDEEGILAMSGELEALAPGDRRTLEFLARVREIARSAAGRKRLEGVFARGRELILMGDYPGALGAYGEGLEFYREAYIARNQGRAEDPARGRLSRFSQLSWLSQLSRLSAAINAFQGSLAALDRTTEELAGAPGGPPPGASRQVYDRLTGELGALGEICGEIAGAGAFFKGEALSEAGGSDGSSDRGLDGALDVEGILQAAAGCWESRTARLEALLRAPADEAYDLALSKARGGRYGEAAADYEEALLKGGLARDFLETTLAFREDSALPGPSSSSPAIPLRAGILVLLYRDSVIARSGEVGALELGLEGIAARSAEGGTGGDPASPDSEDPGGEFRVGLEALAAGAENLEGELQETEEEFRCRLEAMGPGFDAPAREMAGYTADVLGLLAGFRSRCAALEQDRFFRLYTALNGELRGRLERREAELALAGRFMGGLSREAQNQAVQSPAAANQAPTNQAAVNYAGPEEGAGILYYYTGEARELFTGLAAETEGDLRYAGEILARYGEEPSSAALEALREEARKLEEDLGEVLRRGIEGAGRAEERLGEAEYLRSQGDRYYRKAREAAEAGDFTGARDSIQRAAEQYNESLAIQEFPSLREEWDTRMLALGQEIGQKEHEAVVKELRDALNQARIEYLTGNFQHAENLLLKGRNRWQETSAEENPEISYWLSTVRNALSFHSGREIPVTAPLFAEMSQILSDARGSYEEGAALIRDQRRDQGLARFNDARQKIRNIRLVFPENQEAGMLELRMDQISDPETFNTSFQSRLDEAIGTIAGIGNRSIKSREAREAFAELQNLAEINPSYPGIAAALRRAEIDMGYRPAPPDPEKIRRSGELTQAARAIVEANDRELFQAALRQLNEALSLDPDNTGAMSLKDQVQTRMGAGNALLSSVDEREYQRAVRELQRGNTLISMTIVNQLLRNPQNRGSTRVLELQRRIQSLL